MSDDTIKTNSSICADCGQWFSPDGALSLRCDSCKQLESMTDEARKAAEEWADEHYPNTREPMFAGEFLPPTLENMAANKAYLAGYKRGAAEMKAQVLGILKGAQFGHPLMVASLDVLITKIEQLSTEEPQG